MHYGRRFWLDSRWDFHPVSTMTRTFKHYHFIPLGLWFLLSMKLYLSSKHLDMRWLKFGVSFSCTGYCGSRTEMHGLPYSRRAARRVAPVS